MAERRMMAKSVIETDHFMDMPMSSQCLYFHLLLRADDDGFITSPRRIMREVGCHEDDMKLLVAKNYIIPFDSGVIVIKHWKIHNFIRSDRYTPTHCDERAQVELTKKKIYELKTPDVDVLTTSTGTNGMTCGIPVGIPTGTPHGNQAVTVRDTQVRLGKVRLGKVNNTTTTTTRACAGEDSDTDQALSRVVKLYADNINPSYGPIESEKLLMLYDRYHGKWLEAAIIEAAESSRRPSVKYIEAILERWERDGFKAPKQKKGKKEEKKHGESGLSGGAAPEKSQYAAYFDGDAPQT
uniref:DnaD domain protein n=1 Tax=Mitsuokella multacida TaxID=52226 RepID=UPI0040266F8F